MIAAGIVIAGLAASVAAGQDPARARVVREADRALAAGPFSVMQKTRVAPSGDKHDFVSLGPYWWPDPSRPDGLPFIRRDGEVNPESKTGTDDGPFARMSAAVAALAAGYRETADERYAARAALLLRTWFLDPETRMNPNLDLGQGVPGRSTGRGEGLINTRQMPGVVDAARAIERSPSWTGSDRAGLRAWCAAFASWMQTSRNGRQEAAAKNNHGTWYEAQLSALLMYTGRRDEARARLENAKARLAAQIEPDGRQPLELERTRSWSYSVMNLEGWFTVARLAEEAGVDLWNFRTSDGRSLRGALEYLAPFAAGQAVWPHRQITPFDPAALAPLLDQAAVAWKADHYRELAERLHR